MSNIRKSNRALNRPKKAESEALEKKKRDVKESKAKPRGVRGMYLKDETVPIKKGLSRSGEKWSPAKEGWKQESGDLKISDKGKEEEKIVKRPEKVVGKKRAMEGGEVLPDARKETKKKSKKSEEGLSKEEAKSPFNVADTSGEIGKNLANEKDRANIKSLTQASGKLRPTADTRRLVLRGADLADLASEKMEFARAGDYNMIKMKIETAEDVAAFIKFLKSPDNESLLSRIEIIEFGDIDSKNVAGYQEVLDALGEKSNKLKNLSTWICGDIGDKFGVVCILKFPKGLNVSKMVCGDIINEVIFGFPERLITLRCGDFRQMGNIESLEKLENLSDFSCGTNSSFFFEIPKGFINLKSFSCGNIKWSAKVIIPQELKTLNSCRFGDIQGEIEFPKELTSLCSFKCGNLYVKSQSSIIFSENLDNLVVFRFGPKVTDIRFRSMLEDMQKQTSVRAESKKKAEKKES